MQSPERPSDPHTALLSETESEAEPKPEKSPQKKRKRKRRREKKFVPNFDIPGVYKVVLPELTQQAIGCVAGDTVTSEKPWTEVDKFAIQEHLELHVESSEFLPMKTEITEFPRDEVLIGYIPDESKEYDEFYICVTEEATDNVKEIIDKMRTTQEERLKNAVNRRIKRWKSLGSEKEIEEAKEKPHRSLIEVEIESKYPILPFKVHFRLTKAEDLPDGYMELRPTEDSAATIIKKRIDAVVQVAPSTITNEAQTVCTYPKNSYTQYQYEVPEISSEQAEKDFKQYTEASMDEFCDVLRVNGCIDLYANDYEDLVRDEKSTNKVVMPIPKEYFCFIEMNLSGNKMVSSICWHPMWSGCLIASYVDVAPSLYLRHRITTDRVYKAIHDTNPVLFWSFKDDLKPRLILETPKPIYAISCCPYDPNLIIGGCDNGQIIIWDITNKLNNVEQEEILTINQQKYRDYMFSLMDWMKNIFDLTRVRPTALSDLKYSHKGCVNYISWISPFHTISKTGKFEEMPEGKESLELLTSSEDGSIMIWNLLKKPLVAPGGYKAIRKIKRLKKRPSALTVLESPFKMLHLNLKPMYKINLTSPSQFNRTVGISSCYTNFFTTLYEPAVHESRKVLKLSDRVIYNPVKQFSNINIEKNFFVGTTEGDFVQGTWDGQEFDSGEIINFENATHVNSGQYHDGPIVSIDYAAVHDTVLTVGGRVFALWKQNFKNRPVLWRKSRSVYTCGKFFHFEKAVINLTRIDGYGETWTLYYQSKSPLSSTLMSNGAVSTLSTHPRKLKHNVIALCDYRGSVRLFYTAHVSPMLAKTRDECMSQFMTEEVQRKKNFLEWQETWNEKHKIVVVEEEEEKGPIFEEAERKPKEEKKKIPKISAGQRYLEAVQEQHKIHEQQRIKSIILVKKQLNTEELLKKREPLRKLEEENELKKRKQKQKIRESDKLFKEQVAMLFPDVVKEKPPPPPDPYLDYYENEEKLDAFEGFKFVGIAAQDYVEEHPFSYEFSWKNVLITGRERRKKLEESFLKSNHMKRMALVKEEKAKLLRAAEEELKKSLASAESEEKVAESASASVVTDFG